MNQRRARRSKKRMPCSLNISGSQHSGIVLDVSATGLFIQTKATPKAGTLIEVELGIPGQKVPVLLKAEVVRKKEVPPRLVTVAQGGLGVRVVAAQEDYYTLLAGLTPSEEMMAGAGKPNGAPRRKGGPSAPEPPPSKPEISFRVRLAQVKGSRSRSILVAADDEAGARRQALKVSGEGWKVLACESTG